MKDSDRITTIAWLAAVFQLFDAFAIVGGSALRGAGDTTWPFVAQSLIAWFFFLPLTWLFGIWLGGGLTGAWIAGAMYVALLAVAMVWRFRTGAWEKVRI
jgi:MATE family multidrug resistance protein